MDGRAAKAGIALGQRVTRIGGNGVANDGEYVAALGRPQCRRHGLDLDAHERDGNDKFFPAVALIRFPTADLSRLFWMPYLMGLAYLSIGAWIYRARGATPPGRALAFFCFAAAMAQACTSTSTRRTSGRRVWAVAMAALGGALLSLAMRFPQQARIVQPRPGMLAIPYLRLDHDRVLGRRLALRHRAPMGVPGRPRCLVPLHGHRRPALPGHDVLSGRFRATRPPSAARRASCCSAAQLRFCRSSSGS